jgi:very-short-patch-repair endonuclease
MLIRHCRNPLTNDVVIEDQLAQCDSKFERRVLRRILARGYPRVRSQVRVGSESHSFRIDLVVEGPESRLAVECDGERWHGEDRWHDDRARQEVLERAGWTFHRLRGSAFFRDPERAMEPL